MTGELFSELVVLGVPSAAVIGFGEGFADEFLEALLFGGVVRPGQEAGYDRGLGLGEGPFGEPGEEVGLAVALSPALVGAGGDLFAGEPPFDHPGPGRHWFASLAALNSDPGIRSRVTSLVASAKTAAGLGQAAKSVPLPSPQWSTT